MPPFKLNTLHQGTPIDIQIVSLKLVKKSGLGPAQHSTNKEVHHEIHHHAPLLTASDIHGNGCRWFGFI
jgi:hypothetical protein